ncbi:MAG: hypothetical protein GY732_02470 [Gammaproteobacteria bacterium]|nr:hypothetical protein [Gammaproteobacteria bacterium]
MMKLSALLLTLTLSVGACVSTSQPIPPDSLGHYRDVLVDLNRESIQALTAEYQWNYRNFKERIKSQDQTDPNPLTLRFCGGNFDWRWGDCGSDQKKMPAFNAIAQSRSDLATLNQMMIDYANFLIQFNGASENSEKYLEVTAEKIGVSAKSITSHFDIDLNEAKFGAFSMIGVSLVQQLLAKKQREGMAAVMADFQPGVQSFAELGSRAMKNSAAGIKSEYNNENRKIARSIATETNGSKRFALVEELFALNEQTSPQLDSLRALKDSQDRAGKLADILSLIDRGLGALSGLVPV